MEGGIGNVFGVGHRFNIPCSPIEGLLNIAYSLCDPGNGLLVFGDVLEENEAIADKLLESEEQDFIILHIVFV